MHARPRGVDRAGPSQAATPETPSAQAKPVGAASPSVYDARMPVLMSGAVVSKLNVRVALAALPAAS